MDITKNDFNLIRVEKKNYQGRDFVDIRQYYRNDEGELRPTAKGVTVPPGKLTQLITALENLNAVNSQNRDSRGTGSI